MKRFLLVAVIGSCLLVGCDSRSDQEKLQGEWQQWEMNGWFEFDLPPVKGGPTMLKFAGNQFTYANEPGSPSQTVTGTFALTGANEITFSFGNRKVVGRYGMPGGEVQVCVGEKDDVPPQGMRGGPGERPALLIFRRPERR
jgi:hypothetical protein